ncbi:MAG: hypothetical protein BWX74_00853 [Tenericutes bacterium ADurb.Bin087]|nr:MAG: hypothetical protein BWX74_00853 [Tenericutes bacterium ADurb.Bin087]
MTKQEFISDLREKMAGLPKADVEDRVAFYSEMIDDRMEDGLSEAEAVKEVGNVDDIVSKQIEVTPITKIVKDKVTPKRKLEGWEIILIILAAPIWVPIVIGLFALLIAAIAVFFSLVIAMWSVDVSLVVGAFDSLITMFRFFINGEGLNALAYLGMSFVMAGGAIFLFLVGAKLTGYTFELAKKIINKIKTRIVLKGAK